MPILLRFASNFSALHFNLLEQISDAKSGNYKMTLLLRFRRRVGKRKEMYTFYGDNYCFSLGKAIGSRRNLSCVIKTSQKKIKTSFKMGT